jgi:hypothetical protein
MTSIDQRFSSRVSRIPGMDLDAVPPKPEAKPRAGEAPAKNAPPDRSAPTPPQTKAR